ncbi:hypothetical protein AB0N64_06245 [Microbacterium sp. NPDC089318]
MSAVERWRMPSGRIATIELRQSQKAIDDARDLLRTYGGAVPLNESAPDAVAAAVEGENTSTREEKIMRYTQSTNEQIATATDVAELFADIDATAEGYYPIIAPDDPLYQEISGVDYKPLSWLDWLADPTIGFCGSWTSRSLAVDAEGRRADFPPADALAAVPADLYRAWRQTPNAAIRVGALLLISLGEWLPMRKVEVDGETVVEIVTLDEIRRRQQAEKDAWLDDHPEVRSAVPWADSMGVDVIGDDGEVEVWFEKAFGPVRFAQYAVHKDGRLRFGDGSSAPNVVIDKHEDLTVGDMRSLIAGLTAAVEALEAVSK